MRKVLDSLYNWSGWAAALCILAICVLVMAQVFLNILDKIAAATLGSAFGLTIPSYSDFTGFFLASASFLALAYTLRDGGHIRVSLLTQQLPRSAQRLLDMWSVGLGGATTIYFTWYTALLVRESFFYEDLSSGMIAVPLWIPQSGMLVGLIVLSIAFVDEFAGLLAGNDPSYADKGENLLKATDAAAPASENQGDA